MLRLFCGFLLLALLQGTCGQINPEIDAAVIEDVLKTLDKRSIETKNPETPKSECVSYYLYNNESKTNTNGKRLINIKKGCGTRNLHGVDFQRKRRDIDESQFGEFPWMTAILRKESLKVSPITLYVYICGGALIHPQVVLTAAHCVSSKNEYETYKIRAGEWDTQSTMEIFPFQERTVETVIIHPKFYAPTVHNDIALLILESPVDIAENVDVVCLPPQNYVVPPGTRCFASGWGKDEFGKEGKYQVLLKKIEFPIVERDDCQERFRTTHLGKFFNLDPSFVCAGGEGGGDTCEGDGGSPLVCPIPDQPEQYQQFGMVTWGIGCGEANIPGAYVNVPMFRNWIDEQMNLQNLDDTWYQY